MPSLMRVLLRFHSAPHVCWILITAYCFVAIFVVQHNTRNELLDLKDTPFVLAKQSHQVALATHNNNNTLPSNTNKLLYVGQFGLGHRLSKLSAAYDVAQTLHLPLEIRWGTCQQQEIFEYLFSTNILLAENASIVRQDKIVLVRNDVLGYYAGQSYKNAKVALTVRYTANDVTINPWLRKWQQDYRLFTSLLQQFSFQKELQDFQKRHERHRHYVIGLHLRAGNGEQEHFQQADRKVSNPATFLERISQLIHQLVIVQRQQMPPLVFVATDTAAWIPFVQAALARYNIPVITYPQPRLEHNHGVSYARWTHGQACLNGWKYSAIDMALTSQCDTVVAATRSTFTQILPLSIVMHKESSIFRFCEVSTTANDMTCFRDQYTWLFRSIKHSTAMGHFSLNMSQYQPVVHKVMVHLPDVQEESKLQDAKDFLKSTTWNDKVFAYGERINTKYRGKAFRQFVPGWTFAN